MADQHPGDSRRSENGSNDHQSSGRPALSRDEWACDICGEECFCGGLPDLEGVGGPASEVGIHPESEEIPAETPERTVEPTNEFDLRAAAHAAWFQAWTDHFYQNPAAAQAFLAGGLDPGELGPGGPAFPAFPPGAAFQPAAEGSFSVPQSSTVGGPSRTTSSVCTSCDRPGHNADSCWATIPCNHCGKTGHSSDRCFKVIGTPPGMTRHDRCFCEHCRHEGHTMDRCFDLHPCRLCGNKGHLPANCRQPKSGPAWKGR